MIRVIRNFCKYIVFGCGLLCSSYSAWALHQDVELQLTELLQMADKEQALAHVKTLLSSDGMTPLQRFSALQASGRIYHSLGELDNAAAAFNKAVILANDNDLKRAQADAYKSLGIVHYFKGDNPKALEAYQASLEFYKSVDEPIKRANLLNNQGLVYAAMADMVQALTSYQLAESIYQAAGTEQDKVDISFNIAGIYNRLNRYDIAIKMYHEVIEIRTKLGDIPGLALAFGDIGIAYQKAGHYQKARGYLLDSLDHYKRQNDSYNSASQLQNLAELHNLTGNAERAKEYAELGIESGEQSGNKNAYVGSLSSLAKALFRLGKFELARTYVERSNQHATEMEYQELLNENLDLMSLIYAAQNETAKALDVRQQYSRANDEASNKALNVQLAQYQARSKSTQLQQQVEQLQQNKKLRQLEMEQAAQLRNFVIVAVVLILLVSFYIYRRNVERRSKQMLERKVRLRTEELEVLMQQLQHANEIKNQFLANMSHEIRTPLTAVIGQAEAIIAGDVEEAFLLKEVEIIFNNSNHLLALINDILDLSKIEANKFELEWKTRDLHSILNELTDMFTEQARAKGLMFNITHSLASPFLINIDSFRLKQVLINLCANAIKFTFRGQVTLNISVDSNLLIFKVTDTGIGLKKAQLQQIFESFTQADSSVSRRFGGSGLGLYLSQQLASIMGGKIAVESEVDRGSVFTLSLPCSRVAETASNVEQLAECNEAEQPQSFSGQILLADDHDDNRRLIARFLTALGLEVICARNGKEALELFAQHQPQLILLDIQMPEMDGIEAFKQLRQSGCLQPIVALTANAMSHEVEQYLALGFDGHLKKPIERNHFIKIISRYFTQTGDDKPAHQAIDEVDMSDLVIEFKLSLINEHRDFIANVKNNNFDNLSRQAHRLAGAAEMFGFKELATDAKKLELLIKNQQTAQIEPAITRLVAKLEAFLPDPVE